MRYIPGVMLMNKWLNVRISEGGGAIHTRCMVISLLRNGLCGDKNEMEHLDT